MPEDIYYLPTKPCSRGHLTKRRKKDNHCVECDGIRSTNHRMKNYAKVKQQHNARCLRNIERTLLNAIRARAKKYNIPFNLELEDIVIPDVCPVLGLKLESNIGKGNKSDASPSIDRIIPSLGYVKGNIIVVSERCNRIKNDATYQELIHIGEFYMSLINTFQTTQECIDGNKNKACSSRSQSTR